MGTNFSGFGNSGFSVYSFLKFLFKRLAHFLLKIALANITTFLNKYTKLNTRKQ